MPLPYNGNNIPLARENRKKATKQENHLWYDFLSTYPIRFQRQKCIDNYIADFYCHQAKLIIEIDGKQHTAQENVEHDEYRSMILEKYGLKVIRITNRAIDRDFYHICDYIDQVVQQNLGDA